MQNCSTIAPIISIVFRCKLSLPVPLRISPTLGQLNRTQDNRKRSLRIDAREEKTSKYLSRKNSCRAEEENTKTRLERNGNGGSPPRNLFISVPLSLSRGAATARNAARGMQIFWHERARACNNFMEISRPTKCSPSHRVSRAGDATRIEKRGRKRKKTFSPSSSLYRGR